MRKKLVLSVMGILLILGTVTNVMFTRAEKSSDRTWLASIEALEALAEDEIGGSPGGCGTAVGTVLEEQECNGRKVLSRYLVKFSCTGSVSGVCQSGTIYYFYDCYGAQIAENDFTRSIPCQ